MKEKEKIEILERIDLYIQGKLSQDEIDELWKIFLQYPESYEWFETELHLRNLIRKRKKPGFGSAPAGNAGHSNVVPIHAYKKWLYAAVAAVILAIGLQYFAVPEPEALSTLALVEIDQSQLLGADVVRSGDTSAGDIDVAINNALATAYNGETEAAIKEFQEILKQSPNDQQRIKVEMNLGILFYNNGQYQSAKEYFQAVIEEEGITQHQEEEAWWFLGNAYLNLNDPLEARDAVFNTYGFSGRYQSPALALLKKLDVRIGNIPMDQAPAKLGS